VKDKLSPFSERNVHEENVHTAFWRAVEAWREGKEYRGDVSLFPHVAAKYIKGEATPLLDISPMELAYILLNALWGREEALYLLREVGPTPPMLFALARVIRERGGEELLREMLKREDTRLLGLKALLHIDRERVEPLLEDVVAIARKEVGQQQHLALEVLKDFVERPEVKELFMSFLDDWDKEVRKISAMALQGVVDEDVRRKAQEALELEQDPYIAFLMRRLTGG